jgi:hypothetical protein
MKLITGVVSETQSKEGDGFFLAKFPDYEDNREVPVLYTSPYYKGNAGGMVAIPEPFSHIIAALKEDPNGGESTLYFITCFPAQPQPTNPDDAQENYQSMRSNDTKASIYGDESNKPVTQTFANTAGGGLYIQRNFSANKINNNVTLKCEQDNEVNIGPLGVHIRNNEGDSMILNGSEPNDKHSARSLAIETRSSQQYKCTTSDINMKVVDGGDINIENDSTGRNSFGFLTAGVASVVPGIFPWSGNIRLKSRYRNIDLAALGNFSHVNIVTKGAQIQVDALGAVKIQTIGSINFAAAQDINMTAGGSVNITGNLGAQIGSQTGATQVNAPTVFINGEAQLFNAGPPGVGVPSDAGNACTSVPIEGQAAIPAVPPIIVPNDYADPVEGGVS